MVANIGACLQLAIQEAAYDRLGRSALGACHDSNSVFAKKTLCLRAHSTGDSPPEMGVPSMCNSFGTLGPWMSTSIRPTRFPAIASAADRFTATVLLPTYAALSGQHQYRVLDLRHSRLLCLTFQQILLASPGALRLSCARGIITRCFFHCLLLIMWWINTTAVTSITVCFFLTVSWVRIVEGYLLHGHCYISHVLFVCVAGNLELLGPDSAKNT